MSRIKRKLMTLLLAGAMVCQGAAPVMAEESSGTKTDESAETDTSDDSSGSSSSTEDKTADIYSKNDSDTVTVKSSDDEEGKNVEGQLFWAGSEDALTYTISFENNSNSERTFTVTDKLSDMLTYSDGTASDSGTYNAETRTLTWKVPLGSKNSTSVSFKATINKSSESGILKNTANISVDEASVPSNTSEVVVAKTPTKTVTDSKGKDIDNFLVSKGQELTYTIHVENPAETAKTFTVKDTVPSGTTIVSYSDKDYCNISGDVYTWVMEIAAGGSHDFAFTVKTTEKGRYIPNEATVSVGGREIKTNLTKNWIPDDAMKSVTKDGKNVDNKIFVRGSENPFTLTYEITVKNPADVEKTFMVTDELQSGVTFKSASDNGKASGQTVTWNVKVGAGKTKVLSVVVNVPSETSIEVLSNTAKVSCDDYEYETNTVKNYFTDKPEKHIYSGSSSSSGSKTLDNSFISAGSTYTYKITWKNPTKEKITYKVTDKLPENTTFVSASDKGTETDGTVTWKSIEVAAGAEKTITVAVKVKANIVDVKIRNTANIVNASDKTLFDADTNEVVTYIPKFEKSVKDTNGNNAYNDLVAEGTKLTYEIYVSNETGRDQEVTVSDEVPSALTVESASDGAKISGNSVTWTDVTIPNGGKTLKINVVVKTQAGSSSSSKTTSYLIKNTATMKNTQTGTTIESNEARVYQLPEPEKTVKVVKRADGTAVPTGGDTTTSSAVSVYSGDEVMYTIHVQNPSGDARVFTITDTVDSRLSIVSAGGGTINGQLITWKITVAAGSEQDVTFIAKVNPVTEAQTIDNIATVMVDSASRQTPKATITVSAPQTVTDNTSTADTTTPAEETEAADTASTVKTVKNRGTGDASNLPLWIGGIAVVVATGAGVVIYKKKNSKVE